MVTPIRHYQTPLPLSLLWFLSLRYAPWAHIPQRCIHMWALSQVLRLGNPGQNRFKHFLCLSSHPNIDHLCLLNRIGAEYCNHVDMAKAIAISRFSSLILFNHLIGSGHFPLTSSYSVSGYVNHVFKIKTNKQPSRMFRWMYTSLKGQLREFPGGLVVRIRCIHCCGPDSISGGREIPRFTAQPKKNVNLLLYKLVFWLVFRIVSQSVGV